MWTFFPESCMKKGTGDRQYAISYKQLYKNLYFFYKAQTNYERFTMLRRIDLVTSWAKEIYIIGIVNLLCMPYTKICLQLQ